MNLRWELNAKYEPMKMYSSKAATMIEAFDGHKAALGILLSSDLASRIEKAVCAGRRYRKVKRAWDAKRSKPNGPGGDVVQSVSEQSLETTQQKPDDLRQA
jgi:hypothetical protein